MLLTMNNISFKSSIKPVTRSEFYKITNTIGRKNFVDYPWTVKETIQARSAYTNNVFDCTVLGLTDGEKVTLLHLCPTKGENKDFNKIINFIEEKVDLKNSFLQALLLGSQEKSLSKSSATLYNKLLALITKYNIPTTQLACAKEYTDVAYQSNTDEWIVTSYKISRGVEDKNPPEEILRDVFKKVIISDTDEII